MTRDEMETVVGSLLTEQERLRRFHLNLPPDKLMLLKRLLQRLGWRTQMSRKYAARPKSYPELIRHAAAAMDNPMDGTTVQSFADHLAEAHPESEAAQAFLNWTQGGDFKDIKPHIHPRKINGYMVRGPYDNTHQFTPEELKDAPDIELRQQRSEMGGRDWNDEQKTYVDRPVPPTLPMFAKRNGDNFWHLRTYRGAPTHLVTRSKGKPLTTTQVAHQLYTSSGPAALVHLLIGLRHFAPNSPRLAEGNREVKFRRHGLSIRKAKVDGHVQAHHLVAGFPIEIALRHLANDPKNSGNVRNLALIALTGKGKFDKEAKPEGKPEALWALHDALRDDDHPMAETYNWMSAGDKVSKDAKVYRAMRDVANNYMARFNYPHDSWDASPEAVATRVRNAMDEGHGMPPHLARESVHVRMRHIDPDMQRSEIDESLKRHALRAAREWRKRNGVKTEEYDARAKEPHDPKATHTWVDEDKVSRYKRRMLLRYSAFSSVQGWWMSPDGMTHAVPGNTTHAQWAAQNAHHPQMGTPAEGMEPLEHAYRKGWQRMIGMGNTLIVENPYAHPNYAQKNAIKDHVITHRMENVEKYHPLVRPSRMQKKKYAAFRAIRHADPSLNRKVYAEGWLALGGKVPKVGRVVPTAELAPHKVNGKWVWRRVQGSMQYAPMEKHFVPHISLWNHPVESQSDTERAHILALMKREGRSADDLPTPEDEDLHYTRGKPKKYSLRRNDFLDSLRRIQSSNQQALHKIAEEVSQKLGLTPTKVLNALHDTPTGSMPGIAQAIYGRASPEQIHTAASWIGLTGGMQGVAAFHLRPNGPDTLYRFRQEGSGLDIRSKLDRAGISQRVLIPHRKGFDVIIPDKGSQLAPNVQSYSQAQGLTPEESRGFFHTVGAADSGDARAKFRDSIVKGEQQPKKMAPDPDGGSGPLTDVPGEGQYKPQQMKRQAISGETVTKYATFANTPTESEIKRHVNAAKNYANMKEVARRLELESEEHDRNGDAMSAVKAQKGQERALGEATRHEKVTRDLSTRYGLRSHTVYPHDEETVLGILKHYREPPALPKSHDPIESRPNIRLSRMVTKVVAIPPQPVKMNGKV